MNRLSRSQKQAYDELRMVTGKDCPEKVLIEVLSKGNWNLDQAMDIYFS